VCHADVNRQQQQQQQTEATSQLHRGAAVAFKYPQQQQQPLSKVKLVHVCWARLKSRIMVVSELICGIVSNCADSGQ
jgi:hypothetical protein